MAQVSLKVNGRMTSVEVDPQTPLLYVLRNDMGLNAPKFGCGLAQCGACTVVVNGTAVRSCSVPVGAMEGQEVVTLEGLGTVEKPHAIQKAFIEEQAAQCGYCINGMMMTAYAFLKTNPRPTDRQIKAALNNNLCRCGTHLRVIRAVKRAAAEGV